MIHALREALQKPLPGAGAQWLMAPGGRSQISSAPIDARVSAVMILLHPEEDNWQTLLIKRAEDGKVHSGQISFPGGSTEPDDPDILYTALRECEEEVGIDKKRIQVLGTLSPLYIPPSRFWVTPVIGLLEGALHYQAASAEVNEIRTPALHHLFDPSIKKQVQIHRPANAISAENVPAYQPYPGWNIWGATAMILSELEQVYQTIKMK